MKKRIVSAILLIAILFSLTAEPVANASFVSEKNAFSFSTEATGDSKSLRTNIVSMALRSLLKNLLKLIRTRDETFGIDELPLMIKPDDKVMGKRFSVKRENGNTVDVIIYIPDQPSYYKNGYPVVFNSHGGAWISGDADTLDTQSSRLCKSWNAVVVNVDYTLVPEASVDEQISELIDVFMYFYNNPGKYGIDIEKMFLMGYSAGGYLSSAATLNLVNNGIKVAGEALCYPWVGDSFILYSQLKNKDDFPPTFFALADSKEDPLTIGSYVYANQLKLFGKSVELVEYKGAGHGFIEENNPEYEVLTTTTKEPAQEKLAREAEDSIGQWLNSICKAQ